MGKIIFEILDQWTNIFIFRSSREGIQQLKRLNRDLSHGAEIDAVNIASDFDRVYFSINKSLDQLKREPKL
jgi:hypothetical protein